MTLFDSSFTPDVKQYHISVFEDPDPLKNTTLASSKILLIPLLIHLPPPLPRLKPKPRLSTLYYLVAAYSLSQLPDEGAAPPAPGAMCGQQPQVPVGGRPLPLR